MFYFLKIDEIKGTSKNPQHRQEIELVSFQKVSGSEIEIEMPRSEIVAANLLCSYIGAKSQKLSNVVLTAEQNGGSGATVPIMEMSEVTVTKKRLSANGTSYLTLNGMTDSALMRSREPATGVASGKRQHQSIKI